MRVFKIFVFLFIGVLFFSSAEAQTSVEGGPAGGVVSNALKITQIDETGVGALLKPNGKPLLVNFWATWCVPCREEFPDLVKIDEEFRGKIDFITISLDDPVEINRDVPKFLREMNAKMPAYLLFTNQESEVIGSISGDWAGGLPFTVLYNEKGEIVFTKQGKVKPDILSAKITEIIKKPDNK